MTAKPVDALLAGLTRLAGADPRRVALSPALPGRWSSAGLSAALAAHLVASSTALAVGILGRQFGLSTWGVAAGLLVYVGGLWGMMHFIPHWLRQFDRPGPDRLAARWVLAGLVVGLVLLLALLLAWPYEIFLTGTFAPADWADWADWHEPAALLRWAVRGVVLAGVAVPLVVRRALARSAAYGSLCEAEYQLTRLSSARSTATV